MLILLLTETSLTQDNAGLSHFFMYLFFCGSKGLTKSPYMPENIFPLYYVPRSGLSQFIKVCTCLLSTFSMRETENMANGLWIQLPVACWPESPEDFSPIPRIYIKSQVPKCELRGVGWNCEDRWSLLANLVELVSFTFSKNQGREIAAGDTGIHLWSPNTHEYLYPTSVYCT